MVIPVVASADRDLDVQDRWHGGTAAFKKGGHRGSVQFSYGADIYQDPSYVTGLPSAIQDDGGEVTGKIIDIAQTPGGDTYFLDTDKKLYKRTAAGVWSTIGTINGDTNGMGLFYWYLTDTLYITTDKSVSTYGRLSGSPTLQHNKYASFIDVQLDVAGASSYPQTANIQGWWKMEETSSATANVEVLMLGGGGGGGSDNGGAGGAGGGGAGEYVYDSSHAVSVQAYSITVGSGGAKGTGSAAGSDGGDTTFSTLTAQGGGGGGGSGDTAGNTGGSGGGGAANGNGSGGSSNASDGDGNAGAAGNDGANAGGGGGGATSAGSGTTAGAGTSNSISGSAVTYSVGGGSLTTSGTGSNSSTKGSGGGAGGSNDPGAGTNGQDGAVYIRYETGTIEATGGNKFTDGSDTVHEFTSSGTFTVTSAGRADSSGNGNDLTSANSPDSSTTAVEGNRSADFEADDNEYLSITDANQTGLDFTGDMTIAGHFRFETTPSSGNFMILVSKWDTSGDNRSYSFSYWNDSGTLKLRLDVSSDGTSTNVSTSVVSKTLTAGTTYHLAAVYDASAGEVAFYVDGVQESTTQTGAETSIYNGSADFAIGAEADDYTASNFDGLADEVIVWNRELSTAEVAAAKNAPTGTYALGTTVSEVSDDIFTFTPDNDPISAIVIPVAAKGTGDWTVVVHDSDDEEIGSVTVTNANITTSADNTFTFASQLRVKVGATYHFHVYSTVADGTVSAGDNVIDVKVDRLVSPRSDAHPMMEHTTNLVICNGNYVTVFDGLLAEALDSAGGLTSSWTLANLTLPFGYEAICIDRHKEFIAIGCEKRGDNDDDNTEGLIVLWDGISDSANTFVEVPEGGVQWIRSDGGELIFQAGIRGEYFRYNIGYDTYRKITQLPKTTRDTYVRSNFGCVTHYMGLLVSASAFATDNANFNTMVYAWGHKQEGLQKVLHPTWYPSHGNRTGATREIGAIRAFGTTMFIAWKDGSSYGVDIVEPGNAVYTDWGIDGRVKDWNNHWNDKKFLRTVRADHQALASGEAVQLSYDIDQADDSFATNADTANSTVGTKKTVFDDVNKEFKDVYYRVKCSGAVQLNTVMMEVEPRPEAEMP